MAIFYFDSSALIKRYIRETGTAWVLGLLSPKAGNDIFVARIAGVEVVSAITRRSRGGALTSVDASNVIRRFRRHLVTQYRQIEIIPDLINQAMSLAQKHALRGYDAVQLAAAIEVHKRTNTSSATTMVFVSADQMLNAATQAEGLTVEDPNTH